MNATNLTKQALALKSKFTARSKFPVIPFLLFTTLIALLSACSDSTTVEPTQNDTSNAPVTGVISDTTTNSLTVANIKFTTNDATFVSDGSTDFGPGMVVTVEGSHANKHGIAHRIKYNSELEGLVISSNISLASVVEGMPTDRITYEGTMNVMGQSIIVDSMTRFKHIDDPTTITMGDLVEISGMFETDGVIRARRVIFKTDVIDPAEEIEIKGYVNAYDETAGTFMIGECIVTITADTIFTNIDALEDGMKVEVKSNIENLQIDPACTITALEIHNEDRAGFHNMTMIKGMVIGDLLDNMFMLQQGDNEPVQVMIHEDTHFVHGTADDILDGTRLKSIGQINDSGVLMARLIKFDEVDIPVLPMPEMVKGTVISEPDANGQFQLESRDGMMVTVVINAETRFLPMNATAADIKIDTMLMANGMFDASNNLVAKMITLGMNGIMPPPPGILPAMMIYDGSVESVVIGDPMNTMGSPVGEITVLGQAISVTAETNIYSALLPGTGGISIGGTESISPLFSHPELVIILADINPGDTVMIMAYFNDQGVLTARVIEVKAMPDMMNMGKVFGPITSIDPVASSMVVAGVTVIVTSTTEVTPVDKFDMVKISEAIDAGMEFKAMAKGTYDSTTGELTAVHIAVRDLIVIL